MRVIEEARRARRVTGHHHLCSGRGERAHTDLEDDVGDARGLVDQKQQVLSVEALQRLGIVVRHVGRDHALAVDLLQRFAAGRGGAGHHNAMAGQQTLQLPNERRGGARFAHRHRVHP